jgi:hypothetical protein
MNIIYGISKLVTTLMFNIDLESSKNYNISSQPWRIFITWQYHSLDPCRGNEMMVQQQFSWCADSKQPWFWPGSELKSAKLFGQRQCQEGMTCPKSATQSLQNIWQHHSMDPCGGNEMVQQQFSWCAGCKRPWFWLQDIVGGSVLLAT